jgi:hypothetical protein
MAWLLAGLSLLQFLYSLAAILEKYESIREIEFSFEQKKAIKTVRKAERR